MTEGDQNEHGRDVELAKEDTEAEEEEDEELTEAQREARREHQEEQRRQDIEHGSTEREVDARDQENPDSHRDERPFNN